MTPTELIEQNALREHAFLTAVQAEMESGRCDVGEAIARCAQRDPRLYAQWLDAEHRARRTK